MFKRTLVLVVFITLFCIAFVFAMGGRSAQEERGRPTREYKTHVSKYGFSVSYPADWYLVEEWHSIDIPESKKGWLAFGIYNVNPDEPASVKSIPQDERFGLFFNVWSEPSGYLPKNNEQELRYITEKQQMASIDTLEFIEKEGATFCLVYGVPRGRRDKSYELIFYLPSTKKVGFAIIRKTGKYSIYELLEKIKIKVSE